MGAKQAKPKNWRLQKLSWHDIRRPAGAMQNYISQRQVELAGERSMPAPAVKTPVTATNGVTEADPSTEDDGLDAFKKLSTVQMMDHLSRDLTHWQQMITERNEK